MQQGGGVQECADRREGVHRREGHGAAGGDDRCCERARRAAHLPLVPPGQRLRLQARPSHPIAWPPRWALGSWRSSIAITSGQLDLCRWLAESVRDMQPSGSMLRWTLCDVTEYAFYMGSVADSKQVASLCPVQPSALHTIMHTYNSEHVAVIVCPSVSAYTEACTWLVPALRVAEAVQARNPCHRTERHGAGHRHSGPRGGGRRR